jgi:hypothetical protein
MITADMRDKILAAKDPDELVDAVDAAMNDVLDFLKSAGIATLLVYEIDDRFGEITYTRTNWRSGATLAIGLAERGKADVWQTISTDES